jgi:hypothetical protein
MRSRVAFKGRRCIWGGRAPVRKALYMTAMSAGNWNPVLKAFRNRLKDTGKMPKVVTRSKARRSIFLRGHLSYRPACRGIRSFHARMGRVGGLCI